eukprot:gene10344-19041_t
MAALSWLLLSFCAAAAFCSEPMENSGMFEGDMILTEEQKQDFLYGSPNYQIPLAATKTNLWPTTIPYSMDSSIASSSTAMSAINAAIADYQRLTCLRFVRRTNEPGYLHFYKGGGCSSPVGYYRRANRISLASGCWYKGIVMHEIAHSLGFYHEQSRPDRDNYVTILWNNIASGGGGATTRAPATTQSPATTSSSGCKDNYISSCPVWGRNGLCTNDRYKSWMARNCKQTCGLCGTATTAAPTQPPTTAACATTAPPTTASTAPPTTAPACKDKYGNCGTWKRAGYCTNKRYKTWMGRNCMKSCGKCGGN